MKKSILSSPLGGALIAATLLVGSPSTALALDIALTNDDGWDSIGVQSVKRALVAAGHTVTLAAPLDEQSGSSAAIDLGDILAGGLVITKERDTEGALEFSVATSIATVGAEPATSSLVAIDIARQRSGRLPDLVVSGTNDGANTGSFTQISGTVGASIAALSSTFNGSVPSIAISTDEICGEDSEECRADNEAHFDRVASFLVGLIERLESKPGILQREPGLLPAGVGLNVNYPPVDVPAGVVIAQQGRTALVGGNALTLQIGCRGPCADIPVGSSLTGGILGVEPDATPERRNADTTAFSQGYVTIVPVVADYTIDAPRQFESVESVLRGLPF